ncbi:MAG: 50S ribosomal protein L1 [Candidatus Oxydemutatoraceae bacterium WSBS_2016_MAG_OTU14]
MNKPAKRIVAMKQKVAASLAEEYSPSDALTLLKECAAVKFAEAVDVSFNLGIDPKKGDQAVRGVANLPNGLGKTVRVIVFTQPDKIDAAKEAGADQAGLEDLIEKIQKEGIDFDVAIATPDAMGKVGQLGTVLGPKGLMPNPKLGTVTDNLANAIKNAKAGQAKFRADKGGVVHATIGKLDFSVPHLVENLEALMEAIFKAKPAVAKGIYFKKVVLTSTMGPGLVVDRNVLPY